MEVAARGVEVKVAVEVVYTVTVFSPSTTRIPEAVLAKAAKAPHSQILHASLY